jgi:HPt (histidine-containing phosphotransfer) domain-containing protein
MSTSNPVDMEMLRTATDGTEEDLRALVKLFCEQMSQYIESVRTEVHRKNLINIHKAAHKAAGSSAVCGECFPSLKPFENCRI